jgi:hypothetical protein
MVAAPGVWVGEVLGVLGVAEVVDDVGFPGGRPPEAFDVPLFEWPLLTARKAPAPTAASATAAATAISQPRGNGRRRSVSATRPP